MRNQITACSATGDRHGSGNEDMADTTPEAPNYESPSQSEPDLHYIHILNAAVERSPASTQPQTTSTTPARTRLQNSLTPRNCQSLEHPRLDAFDREYLFNKGVFDLPAPCHLDALVILSLLSFAEPSLSVLFELVIALFFCYALY